jgi:NAD(P)-dependent dehydrogenase (short-subunit alcohol dehydrogenase family)
MRRVCLLTGASGLLGKAFMERYASEYRILAVHHRNSIAFATPDQQFVDPLQPQREIPANGHAVYAIRADLSKRHEIDRVVAEAAVRFGSVDLLINLAAVRYFSPLLKPGALDWAESLFKLNLEAPLWLSVGVAQALWRSNPADNLRMNRNIINLSSTAGLFVYPDAGQALYGTSKAALNHLTYHLASEFWDIGVRVNAIAPNTFPGIVATERVLDAIAAFDTGSQTGEVLRLDAAREATGA